MRTWALSMVLLLEASAQAQDRRPWVVWEKTSPCSAVRQEWFTVALDNPSPNGPSFYTVAPGYRNTLDFADATAQAVALRTGERFRSVCCREYSTWKNNQTGAFSVVHGMGSPGFGWVPDSGNLCCEEAEARAGIPGGCSGAPAQNHGCFGNDPGMANPNRGVHATWAEGHDDATIAANLTDKIGRLFNCGLPQDQLANAFADLSVEIAQRVGDPACYGGDNGANSTDWKAHRDWAMTRRFSQMRDNLAWKAGRALGCLDRAGKVDLFAELSVSVAKAPGSPGGTRPPPGPPGTPRHEPPPRPPTQGPPPQGPAGPGTLVLIGKKRFPEPIPWTGWTASEGSISYADANGYSSQNSFTPPPAQLQPGQSFTITTHSHVQAAKNGSLSGGMTMSGDFDFQPSNTRFDITAEPGRSADGGKTITVTAPKNPRSGADYALSIWVNFYVGYEYHYQAK